MPYLALLFLLSLLLSPVDGMAERLQGRFPHGGTDRSYRLYVPATDMAGARLPLVVVLHGGGGSSREVIYSTRGRFDVLAERDDAIILYPEAIDRIWDTGGGEISSRLTPRRDDDGFLSALIVEISRQYLVDPDRIFITGISRGGMMAYAFGCSHPDLVRAIAPVAMTLPANSARSCTNTSDLGFFLIHGTADPYVPYNGGAINLGRRDRDHVISAPESYAIFQRKNGCRGDTIRRAGSVTMHEATGCTAPTVFASVGGGGHGWPGGRKVLPGGRAGPINTDITAVDEIWRFFGRF